MKITILKNHVLGDIDCSAVVEFDTKIQAHNFSILWQGLTKNKPSINGRTLTINNLTAHDKKYIEDNIHRL